MEIQLFNTKAQKAKAATNPDISNKLMFGVIALFAVLNVLFGLLYQVSRDIICYTELIVLVISSVVFWGFFKGPIRKFMVKMLSSQWHMAKKTGLFLIFSVAVLLLNLAVAQLSVLLIVTYWLEIQTPSANLIVATLTNNIAGNLLCYTALVGIVIYDYKSEAYIKLLRTKKKKELSEEEQYMLINHGNSLVKLDYKDIINIESSQNCITLHTSSRKFVKYQSLKSFLEECPYPSFRRVHRSYAVNTEYISHIKTNDNGDGQVFLKDGTSLKLSRTFKKGLMSA